MKATIKVKIYASDRKTQLLRQSLGNTRFVWNKLLNLEKKHYEQTREFLWYSDMCREITLMRKEYSFLKETSVWCLQQIARKLHFALLDFVKYKDEGRDFPKYKKKKNYDGILIYPRDFKFKGKNLYLPKIGWVSIKDKVTRKPEWEKIKETVKQVWVKEDPDGFFAHIVHERDKEEKESNSNIVGIDVGIKNTLTMSNGETLNLNLNKNKIMRLVRKIEKI